MGVHFERPADASRKTGRAYLHRRCGASTYVDGGQFQALADPLADMKQTFCAHCEEFFPIQEFGWEDTRESLPKYYARHSKRASSVVRFLGRRDGMLACSAAGLLVGILLGVAVGMSRGLGSGFTAAILLGLVGIVAGFCFQVFLLNPLLLKWTCGESDPRRLK